MNKNIMKGNFYGRYCSYYIGSHCHNEVLSNSNKIKNQGPGNQWL